MNPKFTKCKKIGTAATRKIWTWTGDSPKYPRFSESDYELKITHYDMPECMLKFCRDYAWDLGFVPNSPSYCVGYCNREFTLYFGSEQDYMSFLNQWSKFFQDLTVSQSDVLLRWPQESANRAWEFDQMYWSVVFFLNHGLEDHASREFKKFKRWKPKWNQEEVFLGAWNEKY